MFDDRFLMELGYAMFRITGKQFHSRSDLVRAYSALLLEANNQYSDVTDAMDFERVSVEFQHESGIRLGHYDNGKSKAERHFHVATIQRHMPRLNEQQLAELVGEAIEMARAQEIHLLEGSDYTKAKGAIIKELADRLLGRFADTTVRNTLRKEIDKFSNSQRSRAHSNKPVVVRQVR